MLLPIKRVNVRDYIIPLHCLEHVDNILIDNGIVHENKLELVFKNNTTMFRKTHIILQDDVYDVMFIFYVSQYYKIEN